MDPRTKDLRERRGRAEESRRWLYHLPHPAAQHLCVGEWLVGREFWGYFHWRIINGGKDSWAGARVGPLVLTIPRALSQLWSCHAVSQLVPGCALGTSPAPALRAITWMKGIRMKQALPLQRRKARLGEMIKPALRSPSWYSESGFFKGAVSSVEFSYFRNVGPLLPAPLCVLALGLWQYRWTLKCKSPGR